MAERIKLKTLSEQTGTDQRKARVTRAQSSDLAAFQQLLDQYWTWHFDESLTEIARLLLSTDLGWEQRRDLTTPPVGEVISPLGYALEHPDEAVRDAAFQILDSLVDIPAGTVLIGEDLTPLDVSQFQIARYPVTNAQYQRFIQETGRKPPDLWEEGNYSERKGDHPVVGVSCEDAEAYAAWAGCRLPAFEEWARAVSGDDGRQFPWGNEIDKPRCNTAELRAGGTTPVGAFPDGVSPFGCYDMVGNVWEWTSTWYDEDEQHFRVVRGGAWYYNHDYSTCTSYDFFSKEYTEFVIGFRLAR
ncbi:MAG: SUMF1/EgtB/PvdO family nonheme iron enzyme [Candidatus Poribacteria bacterium]|nr:SUMF1/EgtB/PvdO family nonheme iron enzyme [Candidatus Poribacteria bacterium]